MANMKKNTAKYKKRKTVSCETLLSITQITCSLLIVALVILKLTSVWGEADALYIPLMGVLMVFQTVRFWRSSKVTAIISLAAAVVLIAGAVINSITN